MVSLFAQVWLWSLAAFLLGSMITWLLSALPARRKLRKVRRDYADYVEAVEAQWQRERKLWETHQPAPPLDSERAAGHLEWEDESAFEETGTAFAEPEPRPAAAHQTSVIPAVQDPRADEPAPGDSRADVSVREGGGSQVADLFVDDHVDEPGERTAQHPVGPQQAHPSEPAATTQFPKLNAEPKPQPEAARPSDDEFVRPKLSSGGWWPSEVLAEGKRSAEDSAEDDESVGRLNRPLISGIGEGIGGRREDRQAESASTWFQKNEPPEQEWTPPPSAQGPADPGSDAAEGTSAAPDVAAPDRTAPDAASSDTAVFAATSTGADQDQGDPAAGSGRPDPDLRPSADQNPAQDVEDDEAPAPAGFAGSLRALVESRSDEFANRSDPADAAAQVPVVDESEQTPLPRRTPGAGPRPGLNAPSWAKDPQAQANRRREALAAPEEPVGGGMVKGHFSSRKYHTPESPKYDEISAEVLFRTPQDAEEAGFQPWNA